MRAIVADAPVASEKKLDQRQTERRQLSHAAVVSVVGTAAQVLRGELRNISEGGTQIWLGEPLPSFTLVRVEYEDNLILGEVVYCMSQESGWLLGLRVEHALFGLAALSKAMQAF
jgi:hypothetical protein